MKNKIVYTFTSERLDEFKSAKKNNDEVVTVGACLDEDGKFKIDASKNYYIDVSNSYKTNNGANNVFLEQIMSKAFTMDNAFIILDDNCKSRFKQDFATSFDEFKSIQAIYGKSVTDNFSFIDTNTDGLKKLEKALKDNLIGHEGFREDFLRELSNFPILYQLGEMKILSVFICGNPGVGKTEFAKVIHKTMFNNSKMIKINMGNYKTQGALNSLIGSPIGFVGSERGGELSNKIRNSNSKVVLIDEFEKADNDIFNFFYELLEDGKFTDLAGNEFDLSGYVIIFTTNLSKDNYKNYIPAPLVSRLTMKSSFDNPNNNEKNSFIEKRLNQLMRKYKYQKLGPKITLEEIKQNIDYEIINKVSDFRIINRMIRDALTKAINDKKTCISIKYKKRRKKGNK